MPKIVFDTNVLLDYFGVACAARDHDAAVELVSELAKRSVPFVVTPTILKDFNYLFSAALKRDIRQHEGEVSDKDARAIQAMAEAALESILDIGTIASEGLSTCEMARSLCKNHSDYEDNLVAAVALRIGADCIVTRDKAFAKHSPVLCVSAGEALDFVRTGAWG